MENLLLSVFSFYNAYRIQILVAILVSILLVKRRPKRTQNYKEIIVPQQSQNANKIKIFYATGTQTTKKMAYMLHDMIKDSIVLDLATYDADLFMKEESICLFLLATWTDGKAPESSTWFSTWLEDVVNDFRVSKGFKLKYSIFALGDSEYKQNFCKFGRIVDRQLKKMGAKRITQLLCGDRNNEMEKTFEYWSKLVVKALDKQQQDEAITINDDSSEEEMDDTLDVEEMSEVAMQLKAHKSGNNEEKPMVTPMLRKTLTKQGYKIIGSHSGVKICRWTKSMLRGNGGCYKHTMYGIASHNCMETTPSLACANKCTFCWRVGSNPVGTSWKWQMNEPDMILNGAIENHLKMIKELRGLPGLKQERYEEALRVKHCALSLVGEPIMYPKINEFLDLLHKQRISSFLVTNCQFPEAILNLGPVTQLYVSIDASTKDKLKEIDRPLFSDFWERFISSLEYLKNKGQRTVYRLTLVKEMNMDEIESYVDLIHKGEPDFIEVKGVTFCGKSDVSNLTMKNVPYHIEVVRFCTLLASAYNKKYGDVYEISCEHEHSCCVLITNKKFKINNKWHTWIDFEKFHDLLASGNPFTSMEYMEETPLWAVYGSQEKGFDPIEQRVYRKRKNK